MVIGVTGSSGSGKTTVCEILEVKYNATIINADKICRHLSRSGTEYFNEIVETFGTQILLDNGEIDRYELSELIYNNQEKREKLNTITFKYVRKEIKKRLQEFRKKEETSVSNNINNKIIVIDAPLLFEAKLEELCDSVIAVVSNDRNLQIQRIMERDMLMQEQALARLKAQKTNEFYITKSDYVIENNGNLEELEEQIQKIIKVVENNM